MHACMHRAGNWADEWLEGCKKAKGGEEEGYSEGEDLFEDQSASFPGFAQLRKRAKLDVTDFYSTETRTFSDSFLH